MPCRNGLLVCLLCSLAIGKAEAAPAPPTAIVCSKDSTSLEKLAAKEVRRYVYLRTGKLLPIVASDADAPAGSLIAVSTKDRLLQTTVSPDAKLAKLIAEVKPLASQQFLLATFDRGDRTVLLVVGGDPIGTLYGAYRLAEHLGARFYLHGDVLPDAKAPLEMPILNETGKPLFELRGIQPFHDFPEGPDWWNRDTYKAVLGQLPKMGMNFFGTAHLSREWRGAGAAGVDRTAQRDRRRRPRESQLSRAALHNGRLERLVGQLSGEDERLRLWRRRVVRHATITAPTTCAMRRLGASARKTRRR